MNLFNTDKEKPERIQISDTTFLVDHKAKELRQVNDARNKIPFHLFKFDGVENGFPVVFDKITKNLYDGPMPKQGVPIQTERVILPPTLLIDKTLLKLSAQEEKKTQTQDQREVKQEQNQRQKYGLRQ